MNKPIAFGVGSRYFFSGLAASAILLLTVAIYAPGLHGPYLLDDIGNLEPLKRWVAGELGWQGVVFGNRSGPGGRPLSMLTFLANAWLDPDLGTFAFKATNLGIHLACGLLIFGLTQRIFRLARFERPQALWFAAFVSVAWLWLPMHVSTVLYVIQRMAQLSALMMLASLLVYVHVRSRIEEGSSRAAVALWLGVPALTLMAAATKETGVLALPLAATLEYTLFTGRSRPRHVKIFFVLTVALPAAFAIAFMLLRPDWIAGGYANRDFTLSQRLMTEPRVLWSYLQTSFFPIGPRMGLFHDNYPISTSLWSPWTTAISMGAWALVIVGAIIWRRRAPIFTLGILGYLVAHSIEAGPIGLELYFDHRNYAASLFALIAIVGLLMLVLSHFTDRPRVRRALTACGGLCLAIYGLGTWSQAEGWKDARTFYAVQYVYNPDSPRLLSNLTGRALMAGDLTGALEYIEQGERSGPESEHATATIWRLLAYCAIDSKPAPLELYDEFARRANGRITTYAMVGWELLTQKLSTGCKALDAPRLATIMARWLESAPQSPTDQPIWRTRYNAGRIVAESGHIAEAREIVKRAWIDSARNNGVGVLLFQLDASLNDVDGCREVLASLAPAEGGPDRRLTLAIQTFRSALEAGQIKGKGQ